jgi:hypothetical protein
MRSIWSAVPSSDDRAVLEVKDAYQLAALMPGASPATPVAVAALRSAGCAT